MLRDKTFEEKEFKKKISRYAKSFFVIALAEDELGIIEKEFDSVINELSANLKLKSFLINPKIEAYEKIKYMLSALDKNSSRSIRSVMSLIITMNLTDYLRLIKEEFVKLVGNYKNQLRVEVTSAVMIDKELLLKIKEEIDKKTGLDSRISNVIDASLIGGILIKINDKVIDLSIKNKIEKLRSDLKSIEVGRQAIV
ncbi:MAG TPA: ATP synthase F1 subunit delta [Actinobacteria bacterium]|nr:ATP synthase F1 subunit delta [Actinomycetota bacterium]